jgi:diaminohydroxyphosphoribosylaminopyrimidine deaminase / 5-amino-6-(5-phosphoribosylamino)uracil reductase
LTDESYIRLAVEIAKKGMGSVSPNPLVGCVIIKNDRIIGAGYHERYGGPHAEINAISSATESVEGATLYINLEPCSHHGKTPPCVDRIIECKIAKVVIGTMDMNPLVSGEGIKKLKTSGIDVKVGVLEKECIELNKFFFKYITKKIPFVSLKAALTLDGKIADASGDSKWISSVASRRYVHYLRSKYDAVLIGTGTALKDNPSLTVRLTEGRNPKRIILDAGLKMNFTQNLFLNNSDKKLYIITSKENAEKQKVRTLKKRGINVVFVKEDNDGRLSLKSILKELAKLQISSLLVEGGGEIFSSFIKNNLYDDILMFITPKLLGSGIPVINNLGVKNIKKAYKLKIRDTERIGDDLLIELIK